MSFEVIRAALGRPLRFRLSLVALVRDARSTPHQAELPPKFEQE